MALTPEQRRQRARRTSLVMAYAASFNGSRASFDYYVNSVSGNDSANGRTPDTAFRTIAAANAVLGNNVRIGLARGSVWREQLGSTSSAFNGVTIGAYGSGALPVLDGADVASANGWTPHGTFIGIWQRTWTHDAQAGMYLSLWADGVRVRWYGSEALLDAAAAPGFFVADTGASGSSTIFYKPAGGLNPAGSGVVVEISTRHFGLVVGSSCANWTVDDIRTKRQLHNDGSLVLYGMGGRVNRCLAEDGTKHNLFIGRNCVATDCIAWKCDWADRSNSTAFIAHTNDGRGFTASFVRCIAVMEVSKSSDAIAAADAIGGFYAHTAGDSQRWDAISYSDCAAFGCVNGFSVNNCTSLTSARNYVEECQNGHNTNCETGQILDLYCKGGGTIGMRIGCEHFAGTVTINGLRSYGTIASTRGDVYNNSTSGSVTVQRSVIFHLGAITRFAVNGNVASSTVNSYNNVIVASSASLGFRAKGNGDAQNNNYFPDTMNFEIVSLHTTFADYRTANPSLDVASVTTNPGLIDPANGNFSGTNIPSGMGLERPNVTYTAIPSEAALAAM